MMINFPQHVIVVLVQLMLVVHGVRVTIEGGVVGMLDKEVKEGTNPTLDCSFSPSSASAQGNAVIEWTYKKNINDQSEQNIIYNGEVLRRPDHYSLKNPSSLVINNIQRSESGMYNCYVTLPLDEPSKAGGTYNLTVLVPPSLPVCQFPSDYVITLGFSQEFRCYSTEGVPDPTYTWFKDGVALPELGGQESPQYKNTSFTYSKQTGTLTFSKVVSGDAGKYYCTASNSQGSETCNEVKIVTKSQDVGAIVGIVFGVIFAVLLIGVLVWWTWRKGYCDSMFNSSELEEHEDEDANDIMLDSNGPMVHKPPSVANGSTGKLPDGAVRVMP